MSEEIVCAAYTKQDQNPVIRPRAKSVDSAQKGEQQELQDNGFRGNNGGRVGRYPYRRGNFQRRPNYAGCWNCGSWRHKMAECDAQPSDGPTNNSKREITCFKCGKERACQPSM